VKSWSFGLSCAPRLLTALISSPVDSHFIHTSHILDSSCAWLLQFGVGRNGRGE
jgi:hypothetical protein